MVWKKLKGLVELKNKNHDRKKNTTNFKRN